MFKCLTYSLLLTFAITSATSITARGQLPTISADSIRLNQVGFYPNAGKIAVVLSGKPHKFIILKGDNEQVFAGTLKASAQPDLAGRVTYIANFTALQMRGRYRLAIPEMGASYPMEIKPGIHAQAAAASIKAFYYQRASIALPQKHAGKWARPMGHPDDKVLIHPSAATEKRPAGTVISSPRGWYDAGDYNKYVVNSGISMGTLLSLYEDFPDYMKTVRLNIPESTNQVPDVLDETLWNLRWMLTMQDPNDGGVYHKLTNAAFDAMIMPDKATTPRYVVQKGTAATLDFAAVMAQASRVYKAYNKPLPGLSDSCLKAAVQAWQWALANPNVAYNQDAMNTRFKPEVSTGAYGDQHFEDEFTWAATELYITTLNDAYLKGANATNARFNIPSWPQVNTLGYYSLLRNRTKLTPAGKALIPALQAQLITFASNLMKGWNNTAYETVMGKTAKDFGWGSNSNAANQGIALLQAYLLTGKNEYADAALSNLDYLLGRNGTGYCYESGFGRKPIMHPHHRPSIADGIAEPVPGLLSGGPNPGRQDKVELPSLIPNQAFVDNDQAYAVNEIAINWNAPFAYLINAIEALQYKRGYSAVSNKQGH
ncbi:glycoside hydrolase family 9 protein [Mucilaginibacter galii]|uniref:Endoglucanase n=1 Tax=Mucilaginibacter galii TaxID=2005073 RepID=A0A917J977_9SPHI|nr:glycoside hydrolase family 9 protein [Mucilaginibacter galii]GGI50252.1 endoglucanase [Mucilaginibacter galii]